MNAHTKRSHHRNVRKVNIPPYIVLTLFLIITISTLVACTSLFRSIYAVSSAVVELAATSMTFIAESDAQVNESSPSANYGNSTYLQVDGAVSYTHLTLPTIYSV